MSLKAQIEGDIKKAMLAKNQPELLALRSIKSLILLAETEKGAKEELTADKEIQLLTKAAKQRRDSIDVYTQQNREDLKEKEEFELGIIEKYLPKQLTEEELAQELKAIIVQVGAAGPSDLGKVMGVASKSLAGKADGKMISAKVKELLG